MRETETKKREFLESLERALEDLKKYPDEKSNDIFYKLMEYSESFREFVKENENLSVEEIHQKYNTGYVYSKAM